MGLSISRYGGPEQDKEPCFPGYGKIFQGPQSDMKFSSVLLKISKNLVIAFSFS